MKPFDFTRPDKLLAYGLKTLGSLAQNLYSDEKTEAKAKAELTFIGEQKVDEVQTQLYSYNQVECVVEEPTDYAFLNTAADDKVHWLNFHGIHDVELIRKIGAEAQLDRLTIRQILDTTQRPKVEESESYLYFNVKSISKKEHSAMKVEQLSFVLGPNYVISFQEEVGDHFQSIRDKLNEGIGQLRRKKNDFLLAQLLDAILDNYFESIELINKEIGLVENNVFKNPDKSVLILLESHKRTAQLIKKSLNPFRESLQTILNEKTTLIQEQNQKYYRDLSHSVIAAIEEVDTALRNLDGLTNIYFASLSQKMNETMKVLTTVATIFIPLTFIAGVYGMNFVNMPELRSPYGYYMVWGVMVLVAGGMLIYFRKKKWL